VPGQVHLQMDLHFKVGFQSSCSREAAKPLLAEVAT